MRLDVAVGVLAHTLPLVAESSLFSARKRERSLLQNEGHNTKHESVLRSNEVRAALFHEAKPESRKAQSNMLENKGKPMSKKEKRASTHDSRKNATECNPRSNNPDAGILSCGMDNHCVQDDESTLGGFCIAYEQARAEMHRSLQDGGLCDDEYFDCDCRNFENGVGTYVCAGSECVDDENTICGRKEDVVVVNSDGSYRTSTCFLDTDGSPIEGYCYTTEFDGIKKGACEIEYNGIMCSKCEHVVCADEFGGGEGIEFDCSNASTDISAKGTTCDGGDWRDIFLDPQGPAMPTPASSMRFAPIAAPTVADPNAVESTPSEESTAEPTSDAGILKTTFSYACWAVFTMGLLAATAVS